MISSTHIDKMVSIACNYLKQFKILKSIFNFSAFNLGVMITGVAGTFCDVFRKIKLETFFPKTCINFYNQKYYKLKS